MVYELKGNVWQLLVMFLNFSFSSGHLYWWDVAKEEERAGHGKILFSTLHCS